MDLSAATIQPPLVNGKISQSTHQLRIDNGLCLYDRQKGHLLDNCPNKGKAKPLAIRSASTSLPGSRSPSTETMFPQLLLTEN